MRHHAQQQGEFPFRADVPIVQPGLPPALQKLANENRGYLQRFLAEVFSGNTSAGFTADERDRCIKLNMDISHLSDAELANRVLELDISVREHPRMPQWAKIAFGAWKRIARTLAGDV